jgi:amidophosphoribosyltransferase
MNTECGVLAFINLESCEKTLLSNDFVKFLELLQHRGQDSCGISYVEQVTKKIITTKSTGLISELYPKLDHSESNIFIGHTRYSTLKHKEKDTDLLRAHPIVSTFNGIDYAFVFNGNIPLTNDSKPDTIFITDTMNDFQNKGLSFYESVKRFIQDVPRAYNIIFLFQEMLYIIRDPYGTRPLIIGKNGSKYMISSESVAIPKNYQLNDIRSGNLIMMGHTNIEIEEIVQLKFKAHCLFEYIYFMNKDSQTETVNISDLRKSMGKALAIQEKEHRNANANYLVIGIPNSAIESAKGYAEEMNYEYQQYITRNANINRTFILKDNKERDRMSKKKYSYQSEFIKDRNIIIVDDSIVRGITIKNIVAECRNSGAHEIHIRIPSPPIKDVCHYGVDIPDPIELIVNRYLDIESIAESLKVDSLMYLKLDNFDSIINLSHYCTGCMNSNYNKDHQLEW